MRKYQFKSPPQHSIGRPKPAIDEIYHVYNRGVDKRDVFLDTKDYWRFIHDLYEFNDSSPAGKLYLLKKSQEKEKNSEIGSPKIKLKREILVEILAFCLMPNHYHLMLRQQCENGVSEFMKKIGIGYTSYFNQKYEREGALFQGKYKLVHVTEDNHFEHLPYYIHLNPLDLVMPEWRDGILKNKEDVFHFLETYRWSSFLDYIGKKNFPSVTQRTFLEGILGSTTAQKQNMIEWITRNKLEEVEHIALE
ncbi:MAG: transposase [Patescibacteria group bacterium]